MDIQGNSVEEIIADATSKGLFVVDGQKNNDALFEEYVKGLADADSLCDVTDPENEPYKSKYKAREILDTVVNKLEATKTIATMEKQKDSMAELSWRIARTKVKCGIISWECEEPHHTQTDLEMAADYYSPGFVSSIDAMVGPDEDEDENARVTEIKESPTTPPDKMTPPSINLPSTNVDIGVDAMKCLNMLGILWAGRGIVRKAFLYLISANKLYSEYSNMKLSDSSRNEIESVYTHNLFYLAQAYGHIGDAKKSGEYCYLTLQRQFSQGLDNVASSLDWVKNCMGICDFYLAMGHYKKCALGLMSAEKVLTTKVRNPDSDAIIEEDSEIAEQDAELQRRWANLDIALLTRAYRIEVDTLNCEQEGVPYQNSNDEDIEDNDNGAAIRATSKATDSNISFPPITVFEENRNESSDDEIEYFSGIPICSVPFLCVGDIKQYETARVVFLRAQMRIDAAKRFYLLDGHVSDHVQLLQYQSQLYHYLAIFEKDFKRKLAMENKRIEILEPLLLTLSPVAYEGLHKSISYEVGELYMTLLDIKIEKIRSKRHDGIVNGGVIKKAELTNCNNYCKGAIAMFCHYASFFDKSDSSSARGVVNFKEFSLRDLIDSGCTAPDDATISADEIRSFLNSHFLSARILSKVMISSDTPKNERSIYMAGCLRRYEWLSKYVSKICKVKSIDINETFGEELSICVEMTELLPAKIHRIHNFGESPTL